MVTALVSGSSGLGSMRGHLRQYSVSNSVMKIKFFANKNTTEIEQTE